MFNWWHNAFPFVFAHVDLLALSACLSKQLKWNYLKF